MYDTVHPSLPHTHTASPHVSVTQQLPQTTVCSRRCGCCCWHTAAVLARSCCGEQTEKEPPTTGCQLQLLPHTCFLLPPADIIYSAWLGTRQMRAGVAKICPASRSARGPRQPSSCVRGSSGGSSGDRRKGKAAEVAAAAHEPVSTQHSTAHYCHPM